MPRRATHSSVGATAGMVAAVYRVRAMPADHAVAAAVGGLLGGAIGGVVPDVLEPATHPNHRGFAHSAVAGGALVFAPVAEFEASCQAKAAAWDEAAGANPQGSAERSRAELRAWLWRLLAGAAVGIVAGYASHLVLDACTPRSLPLIGR